MVKLLNPHIEVDIGSLISEINTFHYLHLEKKHQIETVRVVQMGNLLINLKTQTEVGWTTQVMPQLKLSRSYINQYIKIATEEETSLKELQKTYSSLYPMYLDLKRIVNPAIKVVPKAVLIQEPTPLVKMLQGEEEIEALYQRVFAISTAQSILAQEKKALQKQIYTSRINLFT